MRWRRSGDEGEEETTLGLGGRSPDGEDRTDGIDRGASWMRGNLGGLHSSYYLAIWIRSSLHFFSG